jgi:hypothetical protein
MTGKWSGCVLALALVMSSEPAWAGPYLGDWGWCWREGCNCPKGEYCPLHYWTPGVYKLRAQVNPSNLDQYPPGPANITPTFELNQQRCRTIPPGAIRPYADPAAYYGREVINTP